jgi:aromatic-L-amino-acid/L-tryptophan decarboxylase
VHSTDGWQVMAPHPLSVVCIRYQPPEMSDTGADGANAQMLERVNASGEVYLSHTRLRGRYVIRIAIGNLRTEERHVRRAWELLQGATPGSSPRAPA